VNKDVVFEQLRNKRIVMFGIGILQADLVGLLDLMVSYYICDTTDAIGDCMFQDVPIHSSDYLITEKRDDLFVILCENDEEYAQRKLEHIGFIEGEQYCFGDDLFLLYAHNNKVTDPTRIWGTGATFQYHKYELEVYLNNIKSYILSEATNDGKVFENKLIESFKDFENENDDFILVCSIYYKEIGTQLIERGLIPGIHFMNVRTFVKLIRLSKFSETLYEFENRSKQAKNIVIILAGYKQLVYESVLPRLKKYIPNDYDVVVVSSGKKVDELKQRCEQYEWSYLSTERNNVSLAINVAILLFPMCKRIWKIDEDIFVTNGCFESMNETYNYVEQNTKFEIGFVTPIINVNGYGYVRLLELMNVTGEWEKKFGELRFTDCYTHHVAIHDSPEAAMLMWGKDCPEIDNIDSVAEKLQKFSFRYSICPIRYSIGFILFSRANWIRMGMFPVTDRMNLGADEERICQFCLMHARVIAVAENAVAGHLSYGPQHKAMEEYYKSNVYKFKI
jgi:hypothetical protein